MIHSSERERLILQQYGTLCDPEAEDIAQYLFSRENGFISIRSGPNE